MVYQIEWYNNFWKKYNTMQIPSDTLYLKANYQTLKNVLWSDILRWVTSKIKKSWNCWKTIIFCFHIRNRLDLSRVQREFSVIQNWLSVRFSIFHFYKVAPSNYFARNIFWIAIFSKTFLLKWLTILNLFWYYNADTSISFLPVDFAILNFFLLISKII